MALISGPRKIHHSPDSILAGLSRTARGHCSVLRNNALTDQKTLYVTSREEWRLWFEKKQRYEERNLAHLPRGGFVLQGNSSISDDRFNERDNHQDRVNTAVGAFSRLHSL
jgi:hypothetical protein